MRPSRLPAPSGAGSTPKPDTPDSSACAARSRRRTEPMDPAKPGLIERERSCLIVIDVQQYFLDKLPLHERGPLVQRQAWLIRVARALEIPLIATAEDIGRHGPLVPELAGLLPAGTAALNQVDLGLMEPAALPTPAIPAG